MRIPKYQIIEQELKEEIESGRFEYGDRFHSEAELLERYDVSSITVVRALRDLVSMGYLVRKQGKGTFVSRSRKRQLVELTDIETFAGELDHESVRVVSAKPGCDPEVRARLGLTPDEGYHDILRVRYVDETPFLVSHSHIPSRYIKDGAAPDYYASIYRRMREDFGLHLYDEHAVETDEVAFPTPPEAARLLGIDEQTPSVRQHKTTTLESGRVVEDVVAHKRWEYFKIEFVTRGRVAPPAMDPAALI